MPETPEQKRIREEEYWAKRGGRPHTPYEPNRERGDDLRRQPSAMSGSGDAPQKAPRTAKKADTVTPEMEALVPEPSTVRSAPGTPWALYTHFCKAVRAKWPNAVLAARDKATLKFASDLLKKFPPEVIYEMIQVLVLDYEHIEHARIFFKFKGGPTPVFKQLTSNADLIASFVGKGIAPPGKTSSYMEDYRRRNGGPVPEPIRTNEDLIRRLEAASDDDPTRVAK